MKSVWRAQTVPDLITRRCHHVPWTQMPRDVQFRKPGAALGPLRHHQAGIMAWAYLRQQPKPLQGHIMLYGLHRRGSHDKVDWWEFSAFIGFRYLMAGWFGVRLRVIFMAPCPPRGCLWFPCLELSTTQFCATARRLPGNPR